MLNIGDRVYMARYGEGMVRKIKLNEIYGKIQKYYYISLISDNIGFLIPENQLGIYKVKKAVSRKNEKNPFTFMRLMHNRFYKKCTKDLAVIIKGVEIK